MYTLFLMQHSLEQRVSHIPIRLESLQEKCSVALAEVYDIWHKIYELLSSHGRLEAAHFKNNTKATRVITEQFADDEEQLLCDLRAAVVEICLDTMEATDGRIKITSEEVYMLLFA